MNLLNLLQIAAALKMKPVEVVRAINASNIKPQSTGFRAGLYDLDEVKQAIQSTKTEG